MPESYYSPGSDRSTRVHALFTSLASRYDLINDLQSFGLHRWWKRRLVAIAAPAPLDAVLDLCCGTGDVCFRLAPHVARVTGVDFNGAMLDRARRRLAATRLNNIQFQQGDATRLAFSDHSFDLITISYGLRNLEDLDSGLREMVRLLKPGGRLLVLDFGKPPNRSLRRLYFGYLRFAVPLMGWMFCGDRQAYAYILESLHHYPAQDGVADRMRDLGLLNVCVHNLMGGTMSLHVATQPKSP